MRAYLGSNRPPVEYLFIDGAYLREVVSQKSRACFNGDNIELDFEALSTGFQKKFYYDCLPPKKSGENQEDYENRLKCKNEFYDKLRSINGFHVFLGTTSSEGGRARQKGVDIMIAVHMLTHCFRRNMEKATLLTGDLDFKPLLESLVQDGMDVTLWFDNLSASKDLVYAADSQRELSVLTLLDCASKDFLERNPQPKRYLQQGKKNENLTLIKTGKINSDMDVELYKDNAGEFVLLYPDTSNHGYYMYWQHSNHTSIEKLMSDLKMHVNWEVL
jgi:uncharacterized LabA/DUF88 family protein